MSTLKRDCHATATRPFRDCYATVTRLLSQEILDPQSLLDTFAALDINGNGVLEVSELVGVLSAMQAASSDNEAGGPGAFFGEIGSQKVGQLLRAFDLEDQKCSVNYEEFVNMVAGRRCAG